ncbi:heavy-metal-associated domain-containing protein [Sediminicola luteus]|uniref:Heavy metal transporter n=1 Tax=Sediminicola luteus TaxID=319238 RepID=A0A2A4GE01_9FLAO|nr:heavy metal-associated domain-containing protein [Sediminicola luteus]PCE66228.1 heavy metal transporter [Sediminicola luteus]
MKQTIIVQNLKCGGCAKTITKKISALEGVSEVVVTPETSEIAFVATSETEVQNVKTNLLNLGYPAVDEANSLVSKAKSFVSCATGKMSQ